MKVPKTLSKESKVVCGIHSAKSFLSTQPDKVRRVLVAENYHGVKLHDIVTLAKQHRIQTKSVPRSYLDRLAPKVAHQGVVIEVHAFRAHVEADLEDMLDKWKCPLILALDSIQDPRNLGACLRSAEGAGVDAVIVGKNRSAPLTGVVHKTSAGALDSITLVEVSNLVRCLSNLKEHGCWIVGASDHSDTHYTAVNFGDPTVLVVGGEAKGLRRLTAEICDQIVSIPMYGIVPSLNVAVASGIILFEAKRQRLVC